MSFLAPFALVGLLLLAIPVVAHLFKPRRVRQTPFSSLRWLHLTQQRMARRIQWHQVPLFLLRVAFISLLVLALARPLWAPGGGSEGLDRIIVLDTSMSMDRHAPGRPTPWETARRLAQGLMEQTLPGDRLAIVVAGQGAEILVPWTTQPTLYLPRLEAARPAPTGTNLDAALELCRELSLQRAPNRRLEICVLTDNQAGVLSPSVAAALVPSAGAGPTGDGPTGNSPRVRWFDLSQPAPRNAWLSSARLREGPKGATLLVEASAVGPGPQARTLSLRGVAGCPSTCSGAR